MAAFEQNLFFIKTAIGLILANLIFLAFKKCLKPVNVPDAPTVILTWMGDHFSEQFRKQMKYYSLLKNTHLKITNSIEISPSDPKQHRDLTQ